MILLHIQSVVWEIKKNCIKVLFKRLPRTNLHRKQFIPNSHDFPGLDNTTVWFNYFPGVQWYVLTLRTCWKLEWTSKIAIKVRCVFTCLTVLLNIPHNCYKRTDGEDSNICYCHGRQSKDCQVNDLHLLIFNTLHITWSKKLVNLTHKFPKKLTRLFYKVHVFRW